LSVVRLVPCLLDLLHVIRLYSPFPSLPSLLLLLLLMLRRLLLLLLLLPCCCCCCHV
jgi:hypothetical protein